MGNVLSSIDGVLKDLYQPYFQEQIQTFSRFAQEFDDVKDVQWEGRIAIEGTFLQHSEGVGAVSELANLPTAGNFVAGQFRIPMKFQYAAVQFSKQALESVKTNKGGYKNVMDLEFDSVLTTLKREKARQLFGAGNGILARVNGAVTASATVNVDDPGGVTGSFGGARFLRVGKLVAFTDGVTISAVRTITAMASSGASITVNAPVTLADNLLIVNVSLSTSTSMGDTAFNNEPMGTQGFVDDGTAVATYFGLSRALFPVLNSFIQNGVGALSTNTIQVALDVTAQLGDGNIDLMVMHPGVLRAYIALIQQNARYLWSDESRKPDAGTVAAKQQDMMFGDIKMITDRYAPYNSILGFQKATLRKYTQMKGEWDNTTGSILKQVYGPGGPVDSFSAFYREWYNYFMARPNTSFRLNDITTASVYVAQS